MANIMKKSMSLNQSFKMREGGIMKDNKGCLIMKGGHKLKFGEEKNVVVEPTTDELKEELI
jgi:hypothetical protein